MSVNNCMEDSMEVILYFMSDMPITNQTLWQYDVKHETNKSRQAEIIQRYFNTLVQAPQLNLKLLWIQNRWIDWICCHTETRILTSISALNLRICVQFGVFCAFVVIDWEKSIQEDCKEKVAVHREVSGPSDSWSWGREGENELHSSMTSWLLCQAHTNVILWQ